MICILVQEIWWVTAASISDQEGANSRIRLEFGEVRGWRGTCIECSQENKTNWEENGANQKKNIKKWNVRKFVPQKFELRTLTSEMLFSSCVKVFFSRSTPWILNDSYVESGNLDFVWWMAPADKHCKVCRRMQKMYALNMKPSS